MNNISDIRDHMRSVTQTVKISSAQKMIAAAHIGKARKALERAQPYHDRISGTISEALSGSGVQSRYISRSNETSRRGLLVVTADKGLAGGYNQNVMNLIGSELGKDNVSAVLAVGHVGFNKLEHNCPLLDTNFFYQVDNPTVETAGKIADAVIDRFKNDRVDSFDVIYTYYKSAIHMNPTIERLFPISSDLFDNHKPMFLEFYPSADQVLEALIPTYLRGFIYGCLVNAWMSELNSRVTAMDNAIRNGNDMLSHLSLDYNRARQSSITQEITEIVASASSMK